MWLFTTMGESHQRREQACRERGGHLTSDKERTRFCISDDGRILE